MAQLERVNMGQGKLMTQQEAEQKSLLSGMKLIGQYKNAQTNTNFECPFCLKGFLARPQHIWQKGIQSCGCKRHEIIGKSRRYSKYNNSLAETSPESLLLWDYEKNINNTPNTINHGSTGYKYWMKCKNGHPSYLVSPANFNKGRRCPICRESYGEKSIKNILDKLSINYEIQKIFNKCRLVLPLKFDFYLPDYNILIEYQGEQHYNTRNKKWCDTEDKLSIRQKRDKIKEAYCQQSNIQLIIIPYWEFNHIEEIIKNVIQYEKEKIA